MPRCYPAAVTRRRRHRGGTAAGAWDRVWQLAAREPAAAGRLRAEEPVSDGPDAGAETGASGSGRAGSARGPRPNSSPATTARPLGRPPTGRGATRRTGPAPADVPAEPPRPWPVPVRACDSGPLRESPAADGVEPVARHRSNRTRPATADGRVPRRWKRRWVVERTVAWLESFRRVAVRYERLPHPYDGFVSLACAFVALNRPL